MFSIAEKKEILSLIAMFSSKKVNYCGSCSSLTLDVEISAEPGNGLSLLDDGLYSTGGIGGGIYVSDGILSSNRLVNMQGFNLTFENNGIFRIKEGNSSVGSVYDFNDGVDFLNYDATYSANIKQNSVLGISLSITDVASTSILSSVDVTSLGVRLQGVMEYADNAAAIADGLTVDYIYRTGDTIKIVH